MNLIKERILKLYFIIVKSILDTPFCQMTEYIYIALSDLVFYHFSLWFLTEIIPLKKNILDTYFCQMNEYIYIALSDLVVFGFGFVFLRQDSNLPPLLS